MRSWQITGGDDWPSISGLYVYAQSRAGQCNVGKGGDGEGEIEGLGGNSLVRCLRFVTYDCKFLQCLPLKIQVDMHLGKLKRSSCSDHMLFGLIWQVVDRSGPSAGRGRAHSVYCTLVGTIDTSSGGYTWWPKKIFVVKVQIYVAKLMFSTASEPRKLGQLNKHLVLCCSW